MNADGTINSCSHPAAAGTVISLFANGLGIDTSYGDIQAWTPALIPVAVSIGHWSAEVVNVTAQGPFVWQVDVVVPAEAAQSTGLTAEAVEMDMNFASGIVAAGPLAVESLSPFYVYAGTPFPLTVWVSP
jgi:uncharacterized protein (TIGR03437 family)